MPLVRITLMEGKSATYRRALMDQTYAALRAEFDVPEDDRFMIVEETTRENLSYGARYLDIARSDDLVLIQIACSYGRSERKKQALYAALANRLALDPGVRREDVFVTLLETDRINWSFGLGAAQYAKPTRSLSYMV